MKTKRTDDEGLVGKSLRDEEEHYDDDSALSQIGRDMDQESDVEMLSRFSQEDREEEGADYEEADEDESEEQAPVDMELVEETVEKANQLYRKNVDNGRLEIGDLVLDAAFQGNMKNAGSHNPWKSATFKKIAENPKLEIDARTLGSWVRAAGLRRELRAKSLKFTHLSTYHYVELAAVKDEKKRVTLAKEAHAEKLTVKALREKIQALRQKSPSEAQKMRAELDKRIRYSLDFPEANGLKEFTADLDLVKEQYPEEKAYKKIKVVKRCLVNLRTHEDILTQFLSNLQAVVDEDMNPSTD
jgi:hypothetical protein